MSSIDLTLNDFVAPIAICKADADLGNILNIFQQTNAEALAISTGKNTWGIISAQNLLVFLAKSWQGYLVPTIGYPQKFFDSEGESRTFPFSTFQNSLEPVEVYQSNAKLTDFFARSSIDLLAGERKIYLIADEAGQIKGKLDLQRLLYYLGTRLNNPLDGSHLRSWQITLLNSLDLIALPCKIETSAGIEIYLNQSWQELVARERNAATVPSNRSTANWWLEQQLNQLQTDRFPEHNHNAAAFNSNQTQQHCCLDNRYHLEDRFDWLSEKIAFSSLNSQAEDLVNLSSAPNFNSVYLERGTEWNYLKIPFSLNTQPDSKNKPKYWLVLALNPSIVTVEERESTDSSSVNNSVTVDELLATIAHELKSPLTGIVGLSSLLKAQTIGTLNQRQTQYARLICSAGHKLMNIVNDLLELTSLTAGTIDLESEPIDLESWYAQLYRQVSNKLKLTTTPELKLSDSPLKLQLNIAPEFKIAIANRTHLLNIASHLILETVNISDSRDVDLEINNVDRQLVITISNSSNNLTDSSVKSKSELRSDFDLPSIKFNINLAIAKYLAQAIDGEILSLHQDDNCQFTLLIPQPDNLRSKLNSSCQQERDNTPINLTVLCLYLEPEVVDPQLVNREDLNLNLKHWVEQDWSNHGDGQSNYRHRIIEADGLEQAHTLARIWQLDAIVLDGHQIVDCDRYLRSLQESAYLSALPLIVLDTKTTEAANLIEGLNVYPCLLPAPCRNIKDLMQVIQIATHGSDG